MQRRQRRQERDTSEREDRLSNDESGDGDLRLVRTPATNQLPQPPSEEERRAIQYDRMIQEDYGGREPWFYRRQRLRPVYAEDRINFHDRRFGEPNPSLCIRLKRGLARTVTATVHPMDSMLRFGRFLFTNFCGCCSPMFETPYMLVHPPSNEKDDDRFGRASTSHDTPRGSIRRSRQNLAHLQTAHEINRSRHLLKPPKAVHKRDCEDLEGVQDAPAPESESNEPAVQSDHEIPDAAGSGKQPMSAQSTDLDRDASKDENHLEVQPKTSRAPSLDHSGPPAISQGDDNGAEAPSENVDSHPLAEKVDRGVHEIDNEGTKSPQQSHDKALRFPDEYEDEDWPFEQVQKLNGDHNHQVIPSARNAGTGPVGRQGIRGMRGGLVTRTAQNDQTTAHDSSLDEAGKYDSRLEGSQDDSTDGSGEPSELSADIDIRIGE